MKFFTFSIILLSLMSNILSANVTYDNFEPANNKPDLQLTALENLELISQKYRSSKLPDSSFHKLRVRVGKLIRTTSRDSSTLLLNYIDNNFKGQTLLTIAGNIFDFYNFPQAEEKLQLAYEESLKQKDEANVNRVFIFWGHYYGKIGDYTKAENYFKKAQKAYEKAGNEKGLIDVNLRLALNASNDYRLADAKAYCDEISTLLVNFQEDNFMRRRYYNILTAIYEYKGDYEKSLRYSDTIISLSTPEVVHIYQYNRALLHVYQGHYKKAASLIRKVQPRYIELGELSSMGDSDLVLAACYRQMAVYDTAMIYVRKAVKNFLETGKNNRLPHAYLELSRIQFSLENKEKGIQEGQKALELLNKTAQEGASYQTYSKLAWAAEFYDFIGDKEKSLVYLDSCLLFINKNNISDLEPGVLNEKAELFLSAGKITEARSALKESFAKSELIGILHEKARSLLLSAEIELKEENYAAGQEYITQSLELAEEIGFIEILEKILNVYTELSEAQGDYKQAYVNQIKINKLKEDIKNSSTVNLSVFYDEQLRSEDYKRMNDDLKLVNETKDRKISQSRKYLIGSISALLLSLLGFFFYSNQMKVRIKNEFRRELARDIHDDIGGILVEIAKTSILATNGKEANTESSGTHSKLINLSNAAMMSFRNILWRTDVEPVLTKDFSQIIQDFTENSFKSYEDAENMNLSIIGFEKTEVMKNEVAYHTFMIYKELINNILKHNEECMVKVIWKLKEKTMELFVTNAVNPKSASSRGVGHGRGSTYMKERVNILKGQIKQSMTKDNYSVQISLPC